MFIRKQLFGIFVVFMSVSSVFAWQYMPLSAQGLENIEMALGRAVRQASKTLYVLNGSQEDLLRIAKDTSEKWDIRVAAIYALRNYFSYSEIRKGVMELAEKDFVLEVRMMSLRVLGRAVRDSEVREFLLDRADDESNSGAQLEAYRALGFVRNNSDVYGFLLDSTRTSKALFIRTAAIKSLYWAFFDNYGDTARQLRDLTRDSNPQVRKAAVETISKDPWIFAAWICPDNPQECALNLINPIADQPSR